MKVVQAYRIPVLITLSIVVVRTAAPAAEEDEARFFEERVAPLLEQHCFECHSHQAGTMKAGLTLDSRSGWATGGDSGPAVSPGAPDESLLITAIRHTDPDLQMPKKKLPDELIAVFEEWVKRGAIDPRVTAPAGMAGPGKGESWWSLQPLVRPTVPGGAAPPIDAFIEATLDSKGLTLSPEADRRTLIRRLYIDLHGLPPAPEEVEAFVASTDADAYGKMVDTLLASPRYGERWARHWFDVIHFADTHGFEHDVLRKNAWRYRDYLIESLNADTPWPRLIREQLAADVFFPDESKLIAALGFLGAGPYDQSAAGTAPMMFEYLDRDDMVTQTISAFASTTINCARCHDHKFDPVPQADYFALQAVFAGVGKGDIVFGEDAALALQYKNWRRLLAAAEKQDGALLLASENAQLRSEGEAALGSGAAWEPLEIETFASSDGAELKRQSDGSIIAGGARPENDTYMMSATSRLENVTALRLEVLVDASLPQQGPGRADNGNFHLTEFEAQVFRPGADAPEKVKFRRATADWSQDKFGVSNTIDNDPKTSWAVYPKLGESHVAVFELEPKLTLQAGAKLTVVLKHVHGASHLIGRFRLSATSAPARQAVALSPAGETALATPAADRTVEQQVAVAAAILRLRAASELAALPALSKVYAAGKSVENERGTLTLDEPRVIHLLKRGDLDKPGAEMPPGALSAIGVLPARFEGIDGKDEGARRAALANWLADPQNPLTWRSIVNRVWHYHFGRGLSDTPSDFGRMGGKPSHPELLDWLAVEFRDSGGSLKHLHRLICTSAAYRQSSEKVETATAVDPENALLARMNRRRLDADTYRDSVLAVSGCLDLTTGGPGVAHFAQKPGPQVTPVLDYEAFDWSSPGAGRRSIYRVVWRGIPDPFLDALDFPDAALATPTRGFSASPLQSLALLNNRFVLHHATQLAVRAGKSAPEDGLRAAFRLALLREPTPEEQAAFGALAQDHTLAAACRVLLNSSEFLFVN